MSKSPPKFELPEHLERYMAAASRLYAQQGERQLQEIVVNAQIRILEGTGFDNWDGGIYGHSVYLVIPGNLFLGVAAKRGEVEKRLLGDLQSLNSVEGEYFDKVVLELDKTDDPEWRKESGLLISTRTTVTPTIAKRIWGDAQQFRIFLSHKSKVKKETAALKEALALFGISAFVAHADIKPTKAWQNEIEYALATMDAFVALMTDDFHESDWTDQEVGYAIARGVPIIAANLGMNPYGFIGKFQALPCTWQTAPKEIATLLLPQERMLNAYIQAIVHCKGWTEGCRIAELLPAIETLSDSQADILTGAYNDNPEVNGSFGFNGTKPFKYGDGLLAHLNRANGRKYKETPSGKIKVV